MNVLSQTTWFWFKAKILDFLQISLINSIFPDCGNLVYVPIFCNVFSRSRSFFYCVLSPITEAKNTQGNEQEAYVEDNVYWLRYKPCCIWLDAMRTYVDMWGCTRLITPGVSWEVERLKRPSLRRFTWTNISVSISKLLPLVSQFSQLQSVTHSYQFAYNCFFVYLSDFIPKVWGQSLCTAAAAAATEISKPMAREAVAFASKPSGDFLRLAAVAHVLNENFYSPSLVIYKSTIAHTLLILHQCAIPYSWTSGEYLFIIIIIMRKIIIIIMFLI